VLRRACILIAAFALAFAFGGWATASAGKKGKRTPNMPRNWAWPPTPAMKAAGKKCLADLDELGVAYARAQPTKKVNTPIVVRDLKLGEVDLESIFRKGPFVMDCHLARAVALHSAKLRALGVTALRFSTIHNYRMVIRNGKPTNILSRHAIGLAMDVFEFVLEDGTTLKVKKDYAKGSGLLAAIEEVVAGLDDFRTPLTPGNDPRGHDDHFHFEARMPLPAV
jgi:hypothetical protein